MCAVLAIITLALSTFALFYGIELWSGLDNDDFYMALNVRDYANAPLGLLTFYEGHIFQCIFGEKLMNLRILCQLNILVTIIIAVGYYWHCMRDFKGSLLLLFTCAVSSRVCFETIYDWNTASFPFLIITLILLLEYLNGRNGRWMIVANGVVQAIMIATRVPLGVIIPITILILYYNKRNTTLGVVQESIIYLSSCIATTIIIYFIIWGMPSNWLVAWSPNNIISGHGDIMSFIKGLGIIGWVLPQSGTLLIAILVAQNIVKLKSKKWIAVSIIVVAIILMRYDEIEYDILIKSGDMIPDRPCGGYFTLVMAALFIVAFRLNRVSSYNLTRIAIIGIVAIIPGIGSDVMIMRPIWIFILPILAVFLTGIRNTIMVWLVLTCCVMVTICATILVRLDDSRCNISKLPRIEGIHHTDDHELWLESIKKDIDSIGISLQDILIVGQGKYIVNYVYGETSSFEHHMFHYHRSATGSDIVTTQFRKALPTYDWVMLCGCSYEPIATYSANQEAVNAAGFDEVISRPTYVIYRRKGSI
jgi:hypothetical protein